MAEITHELSVCSCCYAKAAHDECCEHHGYPDDERPERLDYLGRPITPEPEPWALWGHSSALMVPGVSEHSEECTEEDREEGCDCGYWDLGTWPCDGCGTTTHGHRHPMVRFDS